MSPRCIRIEDTVLVLEHVRTLRLEPSYTAEKDPVDSWRTYVWLRDLEHPMVIKGNHVERLHAALERRESASHRLVLLESPYAGEVARNVEYARAAMADCFARGEYPYASHLLYTQPGILNDLEPAERELGIEAGLAWGALAAKTVVYTNLGISSGMRKGIERAELAGRPVEMRQLKGWPCPPM